MMRWLRPRRWGKRERPRDEKERGTREVRFARTRDERDQRRKTERWQRIAGKAGIGFRGINSTG